MAKTSKKRRPGGARPAASRSGNPAAPRSGNPAASRSGNPAARPTAPVASRPTGPSARRPAHPLATALDIDEVLPADGVAYPQILRTETFSVLRSLGGVVFGLALFLLITTLISQAVIALAWATTSGAETFRSYYVSAVAFEHPSGMLGANLGIAALIPITWMLMAVVHRVKPRWISSVQPRIRWRYLLLCLLIAVVALNGVLWLSTLAQGLPPFGRQAGFWGFLVVILLTSPLQAAAEEVFFRGYLMQALGSLVAQPWFGVVVSSFVFALLHGTQNLPLFLDRLGFGLLAAVLVWKTGGLEAGIAAHIVNNIFAYLVASLTTSIATIKALQEIGWVDAAFDVGGFALFAGLAYLLARRMKLRTRVDLTSTG